MRSIVVVVRLYFSLHSLYVHSLRLQYKIVYAEKKNMAAKGAPEGYNNVVERLDHVLILLDI